MRIQNSKCFWDITLVQDTIAFQGIYKKRAGKGLLDSMSIWDRDCKRLLDSIGLGWEVSLEDNMAT